MDAELIKKEERVLTEITEEEFEVQIFTAVNDYKAMINDLEDDIRKLVEFYQETDFVKQRFKVKYFKDGDNVLHYEKYAKSKIGY